MANKIYKVKAAIKTGDEDIQEITLANLGDEHNALALAEWLNEYNSDLPGHFDDFFYTEEQEDNEIIEDLKAKTRVLRYQWFFFRPDGTHHEEDDNVTLAFEDYPKAITAGKPEVVCTALGDRGVLIGLDYAKLALTPSKGFDLAEKAFDYAQKLWGEYGAETIPDEGEIVTLASKLNAEK